jgi:hypothetical protein
VQNPDVSRLGAVEPFLSKHERARSGSHGRASIWLAASVSLRTVMPMANITAAVLI